MKVSVRLFAAARQQAGKEIVEVDLPQDATVGELRRQLTERYPSLAFLSPHLMIAVDRQYASDELPIRPDAEIACFPPVSGG